MKLPTATLHEMYVICDTNILSNVEKLKNKDKDSFMEYLIKNHNGSYVPSKTNKVHLYSCCEFKDIDKAETINYNQIKKDSLLKYDSLNKNVKLELLFKGVKSFSVKLDDANYDVSILKITGGYCVCSSILYDEFRPTKVKTAALIKCIAKKEELSEEEKKLFKKKFNKFGRHVNYPLE